ncbi:MULTISPECIES: hypothetical protein [Bifidobacterium]|nr:MULTISPECIES: hypothetical protein [Bifidobacterium]MCH9277120.1 hypothetical protein [Bifidobacterium amazonense]MCH9277122.1 hypothetical protein [Bifidobacterium amazonense]
MIRLSVWFESLKWRIAAWRCITLNWWYLVLAAVLIIWLGVAEAVALPAYGEYAREVFTNLLAGVPSTPPAVVPVTVFQWSCSAVWLVLAYRQWARRQFAWMIISMVCSLLYVPFVIYLVHELADQRKGIVRLEEKPESPSPDDTANDHLDRCDINPVEETTTSDSMIRRIGGLRGRRG